ncbi:hypothetical protein QVD17_39584 [Tagetes erecta]|uniref:MULE transposase domain-containing protein n=1 Tax=Tagetes erecta TaxID=13708 RepID=A0AAD8NH96_TARER|nr:hypothetical protein QVD17_39584 [Tagetes erecta]
MTFDDMDHAYFHYCKYAVAAGFSVRKVGLFWADAKSMRNYKVFGVIMSFDAMYHPNRYSMVLVPFAGIDNHNNNVSFGAVLLASEMAETYKWLLRCFLKLFGKQPDVVVTDQDPTMKKAIDEVFTGSRHWLCMWHVMHKFSNKSLTPDEFEEDWHSVIEYFELTNNN